MKKLIGLLFIFVCASVSAETASVVSQYLVDAHTYYDYDDALRGEVAKLRKQYTVTSLTSDAWTKNEWVEYLVKLAINNRSWENVFYGLYRTNLLSSSGRKFVVFTDMGSESYRYWVYEVK